MEDIPIYSDDNCASLLKWFPFRNISSDNLVRLVCFPFAGGTARLFSSWQNALPGVEICAVELPGRAGRFSESPLESIAEMLKHLYEALIQMDDMPMVFFGHSMGAHLAHRLAFKLEQTGKRGPEWVIVSSSRPPHSPKPKKLRRSSLPDDQFLHFLKQLDGIPKAFLEEKQLIDLLLPTIRADFGALESLDYNHPLKISANIGAFVGDKDKIVSLPRIQGWSKQTTGRFFVQTFSGGHFYITSATGDLWRSLRPIIDDLRR